MATFVYNNAKHQMLDGVFDPSADGMACALLMFGTGAATAYDATVISGGSLNLGTLLENDGSGYGRELLPNVAMNTQSTGISGYGSIDADSPVFAAPGTAAANTIACLLYKIAGGGTYGADASNIPIAYYDLGTFITGGSTVTVDWSATDGFLKVQ